jgi:hypothetical protein
MFSAASDGFQCPAGRPSKAPMEIRRVHVRVVKIKFFHNWLIGFEKSSNWIVTSLLGRSIFPRD